jgi:hypothetical protein
MALRNCLSRGLRHEKAWPAKGNCRNHSLKDKSGVETTPRTHWPASFGGLGSFTFQEPFHGGCRRMKVLCVQTAIFGDHESEFSRMNPLRTGHVRDLDGCGGVGSDSFRKMKSFNNSGRLQSGQSG